MQITVLITFFRFILVLHMCFLPLGGGVRLCGRIHISAFRDGRENYFSIELILYCFKYFHYKSHKAYRIHSFIVFNVYRRLDINTVCLWKNNRNQIHLYLHILVWYTVVAVYGLLWWVRFVTKSLRREFGADAKPSAVAQTFFNIQTKKVKANIK